MRPLRLLIAVCLLCSIRSLAAEKPPPVPLELQEQSGWAKEQFALGDYSGAEKTYRAMLRVAPTNLHILSNLGVVLFRRGKLRAAEEMLKQATAVAPGDDFSHCTLGTTYYAQGKYDEAIEALNAALAINPKNHVARNYLGIVASQKGQYKLAVMELTKATVLEPGYTDAFFNLAVVFATMNPPDIENARKYYEQAMEMGAEADAALDKIVGMKAGRRMHGVGDFLTPLEKQRLQIPPAARK